MSSKRKHKPKAEEIEMKEYMEAMKKQDEVLGEQLKAER